MSKPREDIRRSKAAAMIADFRPIEEVARAAGIKESQVLREFEREYRLRWELVAWGLGCEVYPGAMVGDLQAIAKLKALADFNEFERDWPMPWRAVWH